MSYDNQNKENHNSDAMKPKQTWLDILWFLIGVLCILSLLLAFTSNNRATKTLEHVEGQLQRVESRLHHEQEKLVPLVYGEDKPEQTALPADADVVEPVTDLTEPTIDQK